MSKKWLLALLLAATPAAAHDWYPMECCHEQDCAPVDKVEYAPIPGTAGIIVPPAHASTVMVVTTKYGTAPVPPNLLRRESKDNRMHACLIPNARGEMTVLCIFMPPAM